MHVQSLMLIPALMFAACGDNHVPGIEPEVPFGEDACTTCARKSLVIFAFDQGAHHILRLIDRNDDGDMHDAGEATVFFDNTGELGIFNSQGIVALSDHEILATDNIASQNTDSNVIRLVDHNGDGDALDADEATLWFDGTLPGTDAKLVSPTGLNVGPDGSVILVQANFFDDQPDLIIQLRDSNRDGDALDVDEAQLYYDLGQVVPTPQISDLERAPSGDLYTINVRNPEDPNNASIDVLDAATVTWRELIDAVGLFRLTEHDERIILPGIIPCTSTSLEPSTGELAFATLEASGKFQHVVAVHDQDASGRIDNPDELRILWDQEVADAPLVGAIRDLSWIEGTILLTDPGSDRILRLIDRNDDRDFSDPGETTVVYDAQIATSVGLPAAEGLFTTVVWTDAESPR